jgi:hypothetical protein
LASLMRLFGDTRLAQFNPASKSFLQPFVSRHLLPDRVLQEAHVTHLQNSAWRGLTKGIVACSLVFMCLPDISGLLGGGYCILRRGRGQKQARRNRSQRETFWIFRLGLAG